MWWRIFSEYRPRLHLPRLDGIQVPEKSRYRTLRTRCPISANRVLAGCAFDALPLRGLVNEEDERSEKVARSGTG